MLWQTGPLTPLEDLTGDLKGSSPTSSTPLVVAACWLTAGGEASSEVAGVLAVGTASQVILFDVQVR